jgi:hypothetical protein
MYGMILGDLELYLRIRPSISQLGNIIKNAWTYHVDYSACLDQYTPRRLYQAYKSRHPEM